MPPGFPTNSSLVPCQCGTLRDLFGQAFPPLYPSFSFGLISSGSIKNFINVDSLGFGQSIWVVHSFFAILYNVILDSLFLKLTIQGQMLYFLELFKYREMFVGNKVLKQQVQSLDCTSSCWSFRIFSLRQIPVAVLAFVIQVPNVVKMSHDSSMIRSVLFGDGML